jgi:hypothetical protein
VPDGISGTKEDEGNAVRCTFRCDRRGQAPRDKHIDAEADEFCSEWTECIRPPSGVSRFDPDALIPCSAELVKSLFERDIYRITARGRGKNTDRHHLSCLLRLGGERLGECGKRSDQELSSGEHVRNYG